MNAIINIILSLLGITPDVWAAALAATRSMKMAALYALVGELSMPAKMAGTSYGLPTSVCNVGSALVKVIGSVCSKCYAKKGSYVWPATIAAYARRLACYRRDPILWAAAMVAILERRKGARRGFHRWFDSGDIIDLRHGLLLCLIACETPSVRFWLPTKERATALALDTHGVIPANLVIRLSAAMIGQQKFSSMGATSMVVRKGERAPSNAFVCPAPQQDGACGACRACYAPEVRLVAYAQH